MPDSPDSPTLLYRFRPKPKKAEEAEVQPPKAWPAWVFLLLSGPAWLVWLLAMWSYTPWDAAFSTTGDGAPVRNWLGVWGAFLSDASYFLLGFSVWFLLLAVGRLWYLRLRFILRLRKNKNMAMKPQGFWSFWSFWLGLVLLLASSTALEWLHFYRFDDMLPSHAGGAVGMLLGSLSVRLSGDAQLATVLWLPAFVLGLAWAWRFSWLQVAWGLGAALLYWFESFVAKKSEREDLAFGQEQVKARKQELQQEVVQSAEPIPAPHATPVAGPALTPATDEGRREPTLDLPANTVAQPLFEAHAEPDAALPWPDEATPPALPEPAPLPPSQPAPSKPVVHIAPPVPAPEPSKRVQQEMQPVLFTELQGQLPPVHLLDPAPAFQESVAMDTLEMTSRLIERKLQDFGVKVQVVEAAPGPVVTRYEIEPATGVKGSQIVNLAKDLARSLSLISIRVIETIPGKNYMALELPNTKRQTIRLSEVIGSKIYEESKSKLTLALGKDIVGQPTVADLAKMPHLLVAGTTGSGKSVGINAMILSLLYKAEPHEVRLMLIDPKMLEMSVYEGIPHLLCPVVTDMRQAAHGLNWCVGEMEKRYRLMSKMGVRNLASYNAKIAEAQEREELIPNPFSLTPESPEPLESLPHIVIVIDELADLMMVVGKKVEELIARLAQKARAAGIHLILATQRPSVDVITGLIKANIPTRIAFQVSSKIDSRTILDQMGAESLLGLGDMLYLPSGTGLPVRVHGAFVSDDEVHRVVEQLKSMGEPHYIEGILEGSTLDDEGGEFDAEGGSGENDPAYDQAVAIVLKQGKATTSLLQRHLKIGYGRAARILEEMETAGLVSPMDHRNQRQLLVPRAGEE